MIKRPAPSWIVRYIASRDPRLQKRALQGMCELLEGKFPLDVTNDPRVSAKLPLLKNSRDKLVRRWLYKLIGLKRDPGWATFLKGQLTSEREDENLSWAVGALSAVMPHSQIRRALEEAEREYTGTALELAPVYFDLSPAPLETEVFLDKDDDLAHRWLCLLHGKDERVIPAEVVRELNKHPSNLVVEYSIWSVFRRPSGRLYDLAILPDDYPTLPSNVRRWYLRLLTKDSGSLAGANYDLVRHVMLSERSAAAREGFALGLRFYPGDMLAREFVDWFHREPNYLVRAALLRHFEEFAEANRLYTSVTELHPPNKAGQPEDLTVPSSQAEYKETLVSLSISNHHVDTAYLLAVDAVGFSLMYDDHQAHVFTDLVRELADVDLVRATDEEDLIVLLTGDGFVSAFLGVEQRLHPLKVALQLRDIQEKLRGYGVRFGVHAGPVRVVTMSDGSRQLIGNAINWAVRVMSGAGPNEVLVSRDYYEGYLKPALNEFRGLEFVEHTFVTKHDEPVETRLVQSSSSS